MRRISSHFGDPVQPESAVSPNDLVETARHVTVTIEIVARLVRSQAPGRHQGGLCNGGRTDGPRSDPRSTAAENVFHASVVLGCFYSKNRWRYDSRLKGVMGSSIFSTGTLLELCVRGLFAENDKVYEVDPLEEGAQKNFEIYTGS